jgi:hypothetical protein
MKALKFSLIALALFFTFSAFGQKEAPSQMNYPNYGYPKFSVDLIVHKCPVEGNSVEARVRTLMPIPIPENSSELGRPQFIYYTYLWYVDGVSVGTNPKLDCTNGRMATVYVTQYPSRKTISKSVMLRYRILKPDVWVPTS